MKGHVAKKKTGEKAYRYYPVIELIDEHGKRKRKWLQGFRTKKEAQALLNEKLAEVQKGTFVEPSKRTVADLLYDWLENDVRIHNAPRTYEGYKMIVESHIIPFLGRIKLDKLKPKDIRDYHAHKLTDGRVDGSGGLSAQSLINHHNILHRAFKMAVIGEEMLRNPVDNVKPPSAKRHEMKVWSPEQVEYFIQYLEEAMEKSRSETVKLLQVAYFAIFTGLRRGELAGLRWQDIDFNHSLLTVKQIVQRVTGMGVIFKEPKTESSKAAISLVEEDLDFLKRVRKLQAADKLKYGPEYQDHDLVFCRVNGTPHEPNQIDAVFQRFRERAGLPYIRLHDLRHTHATLLLEDPEINIKTVQERLRHASSRTTLDIYAHVRPEVHQAAAMKFRKKVSAKTSTETSTDLGRSK